MKLIITIAEAKQMIKSIYATQLGVTPLELDIEIDKRPSGHELANEIEDVVNAAGNNNFLYKRIKALCEAVPNYSWADAKYAVENWNRWLKYIRRTGEVPWNIACAGIPNAGKAAHPGNIC